MSNIGQPTSAVFLPDHELDRGRSCWDA